ncbi:type I polyketide synthase [Pseudoalteromonas denitrificans]|uniref:Polyketide-type polyunsaturated fatty acid synthase PfaA n=1 Tax=Pseudoalteromonas denitrificans DSM 6059 TaxID=1123010 RepID=A0A1I1REG2_9GAMM|nr:type I polyketide synthase [Pseudoalteromonas denitrificans]SFD32776.1 polyketide-type polyunsaturated fatty acid synthase PfaA [Pseudoalteromonas denitrificans DSM 6059]
MSNKSQAKPALAKTVKDVDALVDEQQFNSRLQECPIAIVGMASVFADATNLDQYWDNIFESVDSIKDVPADRWAIDDYYSEDKFAADKTYCKRGGFLPEIDFDPMEFGLPPNILELTDIAQLLSLVVARDVLNDAGIGDGSGYDRDKVGITLGVGGGQKQISPLTSRLQGPVLEKVLKASGVDADDRAMIIEKFKKAYIGWEENSFPGMLGNVISGRIANRFDFGGTNCVVDAACAGSLAAIKLAISDLLEYRSEVMISGGVCCDNSPFMYMSFSKTPAFTTNDDIRPFDDDSKGMMIGEGIGMMAFKRLEDAERDGDKVYAVLKGIGTSSDGRFKSIYAPRPDGQAKALKRAYDDAGWDPRTCGLIEAHGTGTKAGDAAEFAGLTKHFGADNDKTQHIALGSVKSQVGHTKAAAGSAGMIKAVLALHHKVLPGTLHIDQPNTNLDIENSPLYLNSQTRPWMPREDGLPRRAGVSSFGFGGTNYHMVLEEYQPKAQGEYRITAVPQSILVTAENEAGIVAQLNEHLTQLSVDADAQVFAFNRLVIQCAATKPATELARCGFVAKNASQAIDMINAALKQFKAKVGDVEWSVPTGIYYRQSGIDAKGKVVALFSGQGSQYVNMGNELACNFPSVMQSAADMDAQFASAGLSHLSNVTFPIPVFNDTDRKAQDEALRLTQHAQPAIGCFSVGLYNTFKQAGFAADFTAGHSFGELTALWAAGVLNDNDYMMLARSRGQAMAAPTDENVDTGTFDPGTMIAVVGDPVKVADDIKDIKDISIANYNSNNQVVVAGVTSQIEIAIGELKAKGYKVVPLPVSAAFHTPLVGHAQKPFAKAIDSAKFTKPSIPVFANGTGKAHPNKAAEIKKSLKNHILESVHFNEEIDNLYDAGGRIFIEFGPKNVLTKLVENILTEKSDVTAIAINANPKKSADLQMRQAAMQMLVLGLDLKEIDPYSAIKRPTQAVKMSPLAMKLTGASYVSPKTKKAFDDALTDGWTIKQAKAQPVAVPQPKVVEKIVEKIVEVEKVVEKIVYVQADGSHTSTPNAVNSAPNADELASSIERSVGQFVEHQQQLLNVHEQYMQGPQEYAKTFQNVLEAQTGNELPESLDRTLGMYHEFQSETLRVHEQYLNNQTDNMSAMLNDVQEAPPVSVDIKQTVTTAPVAKATVPVTAKSVPVKPVAKVNTPVTPAPVKTVAKSITPVQTAATAVAIAPEVVTAAPVVKTQVETVAVFDLNKVNTVMLEVVADKTGYPAEMLELEMDMEADLGIDSIKRVEILGSVQEMIPDLPDLNPEDLAELRTLGEIVDYMKSKAQAATPTTVSSAPALHLVESDTNTAPSIDLNPLSLGKVQSVMMEVVADKTGYPVEMLELEMDMEADLGIDSIKRVEILGSVQETITDLPDLNPEDLAELRTLGEIVSYMQSKVSAAPAVTLSPVTQAAPSIDLNHIQSVMMTVVADKTGYPVEMLELEMDMEADLGIDSIKRVEILGSVQETITDLPDLNPEDLAELRTLGEIVSYMQSKVSAAPVTTSEVVSAPVEQAAPIIDLNPLSLGKVQSVMMTVVAEKTGYPVEMLELEMDMEADLGIDSIKRVEILGSVQETITDLPDLNPEDLAELRTLGEIVSYMQSKVAVAPAVVSAPVVQAEQATPSIDLNHIQSVMMTVVAEKTGYPVEMLELEMDMEADLGIDSIKRVEILGAVQETITDLPDLNPEDLAELRTLGEIVSHMQSKVAAPVASSANADVQAAPSIDLNHLSLGKVQSVMMSVVADKTGYPVEMLELEMDMEADLGIDSIKRVEILGAVQETITDLPDLNPEDLAELRTLGEIVTHMQSKAGGTTSEVSAVKKPEAQVSDVVKVAGAPSATVAISRLTAVNKISQNTKGANALVVNDGTDAAVELSENLINSGWNVTVVNPSWVTTQSSKTLPSRVNEIAISSVDEAQVSEIIATNAQLDSVIYLHPESTIDSIVYPQASKQGLELAFILAKLCNVKAAKVARASFMVVTHQGGQIGFESNDGAVVSKHTDLVQGGLNGLVKTLSHEWSEAGVFCRAIDVASSLSATTVANIITDELADVDTVLSEVGYDETGRLTLIGEVTDSYALTSGNSIDKDSVFLVSGGAKGVTAHCVIEIAKQYQAKFVLLGRSSFDVNEPSWANGIKDEVALKKAAMQALIDAGDKPTPVKVSQFIRPVLANREIAQTLAAIEAAGGQAQYVSADVTNSESVQTAVKPALAKLGDGSLQVTGIIHGAGVLADKFIEQKTLAEFDAVYRTKIDGLTSLLSVTEASNIKHLVLFSSAAGFYGNPGQSDYSIANDILNKTAYRFKALNPQAQVLSFNWGPWDGGMVTPELKRMFDARGVYIIPLDAGAQLLVSELATTDNRCAQILVGNDLSKDQAPEVEGTDVKKPQVSRLTKALKTTNGTFTNAFLADHVIGGNQVLPTVCAIAWMSEAAISLYTGYHYQGLENYKLFKGLVFDGTQADEVNIDFKVLAQSADTLKLDAKISSTVSNGSSNGKTVFHYGAELTLVRSRNETPVSALELPVLKSDISDEATALYLNGTLFHGESLQGITDVISCDDSSLLLGCSVPSIAQSKQGEFLLPVQPGSTSHNIFANDLVYQAMLVWVRKQLGMGSLPSKTLAWQVNREVMLGEAFYIDLKVVEQTASKLVADIALISEQKQILAQVKSAEVTISENLNNLFTKTGEDKNV